MARLLSVIVMAGVVLVAGSAVMSTAFTTAEVQRTADLSVEADGNAVIQVEAGSAGGATTDSDGKLKIDLANLNKDSSFTFGDTASPDTAHVFKFTNEDGQGHDFEVGANGLDGTATFYVKPQSGSTQSFTTPGSSGTFTLADSNTAWVAIEITDTGTSSNTTGQVYINATSP